MNRAAWLLSLLGLVLGGTGCGRTGTSAADPGADSGPQADGAAPVVCKGLSLVGVASLEHSDASKMTPRVVFDGEQFSVVWHSQPAAVSSLNGELRLARVSRDGAASSSAGASLGPDDGSLPHALVAAAGELALVHRTVNSRGQPGVERRLMDRAGTTRSSVMINGQYGKASLAPHSSGHALLLAEQSGIPRVVLVGRSGSQATAASLITAQIMASVWISQRPGGYVALLHSTNSNGELHLFNAGFAAQSRGSVGHGAMIRSPSMATLPDGLASVYTTSSRRVESELYDAAGKAIKHTTLSTNIPTIHQRAGHTALTWTGKQLIAVYPAAGHGQYQLQLLGADGVPDAQATRLPICLAVASGVSAAWGGGRLAVATVNSASGVMRRSVCVTVMKCR